MKTQKIDAGPHALFLPDVGPLIYAFQDGFYHDILPFHRITPPAVIMWYEPPELYSLESVNAASVILGPWLERYGTARLSRLFDCAPYMRVTVAVYAIHDNDTRLRTCLAKTYPTFLLNNRIVQFAAKCGSLETLLWLHAVGFAPNLLGVKLALDAAATYDHVDIVRFLLDTYAADKVKSIERVLDEIVYRSQVALVRLLAPRVGLHCITSALRSACWPQDIAILDVLLDNIPMTNSTVRDLLFQACNRDDTPSIYVEFFDRATQRAKVGIIEILASELPLRGGPNMQIHVNDVHWAAMDGHLAMLELVRGLAQHYAVACGSLETLQFLHAAGFVSDERWTTLIDALNAATAPGHVDVVRFLLDTYSANLPNQDDCLIYVLENAMFHGHVALIHVLPLYIALYAIVDAIEVACLDKDVDILDALLDHVQMTDLEVQGVVLELCEKSDERVMRCLCFQGDTWRLPEHFYAICFDRAVKLANLAIIDVLVRELPRRGGQTMQIHVNYGHWAAIDGHVPMLELVCDLVQAGQIQVVAPVDDDMAGENLLLKPKTLAWLWLWTRPLWRWSSTFQRQQLIKSNWPSSAHALTRLRWRTCLRPTSRVSC
ncbi:Aste57867_16750 [Aphanomyces stellatus]|uniref:Aste57867_16750 protein n=1 Tax=Aphanomyces stellatus TaxID=120398 RepID=A0A485L7C2_9STRA|nr:hypothetical protein As57867_016693 [Aphanomyces stellatus]VFT93517.1 Aste57867_16750 [Aphanomyces stellatus]